MSSGLAELCNAAAGSRSSRPTRAQLWPHIPGVWHVLHCKPRQEKALVQDLANRGCSAYLPLIHHTRVYGHRKSNVMLPLFAGYAFLKGDRDDAFTADRTNRLVALIDVPDQESLAWELANIDALLASGASIAEMRSIEVGTPVEVRTGPFKGQQGLVESLTKPHRLVVQVTSLGRALSVELDACLVEPLIASDATPGIRRKNQYGTN